MAAAADPFPFGTILALHLPLSDAQIYHKLGKKWALCDGRTINNLHPQNFTEAEVDPTLWNRQVPDLNGRVLRGTQSPGDVGSASGSDRLPDLAIQPGLTGPISDQGGNASWPPHNNRYRVTNVFGDFEDRNVAIVPNGDDPNIINRGGGQHRHDISGTVPGLAFVPSNVAVRFVMKVI